MVAAQHGPRGQQHEDPRQQRQVRVPRLGQRELAVAAHDDGEQRGDGGDALPAQPAVADPQGGGDGGEVDDDRRRLQRPRRRAEQAVRRGQQVEAQRARVAALVRVLADPARAARSAACGDVNDVADPELGHRQVEHRVPLVALREGDGGDEQRQADDGRPQQHGRPRAPDPPAAGSGATSSLPPGVPSRGPERRRGVAVLLGRPRRGRPARP